MLPGLQFTEYHKFLVSAGGLSVGAAVALPIFLLKLYRAPGEATPVGVSIDGRSQRIIEIQQSQLLFVLEFWPFVSGALLLLGCWLILHGAIVWRKRQKILNSREEAEIRRIGAEENKLVQEAASYMRLHQIPGEEIVGAAEAETDQSDQQSELLREDVPTNSHGVPQRVVNLADTEVPEARPNWVEEVVIPDRTPRRIKGAISYLVDQERAILRISDALGDGFIVNRWARVGGKEIPATFLSVDETKPNLIIDVKTVSKSTLGRKLSDVAHFARDATQALSEKTGVNFHPVVVMLISDDYDAKSLDSLKERIYHELRHKKTGPLTVIVLNSDQIRSMTVHPGWFESSGLSIH